MAQTGLTAVTLRGLMNGTKDCKITTLLATADKLGLEVMLVPKDALALLGGDPSKRDVFNKPADAAIPTVVGAALQRSKGTP
jgi:hypothetical protein